MRAGPLRLARDLGRGRQARQLLIVGDQRAFGDEEVGDPGSLLIGDDHGFAARHEEAGHPDQVGEAGIGRLRHDDQRLARRFLGLGAMPVLEQIIADAERNDEDHRSGRLEIFGEIHRRIVLAWLTAIRTRPIESVSLK
ncbi:hypothetical protein ACVWYI_000255 [Bradyrhizobium sp. LB13.1]